MATLVLQAVGSYFGPIGAQIGAAIGSAIDSYVLNSFLAPSTHQEGPRLSSLQVQASTEGAPIPEVVGGVRVAGQIIWATDYNQVGTTQSQGGKGGGGQATATTYQTYANFAVELCEGPIDSIGRIWADGNAFDQTSVTMRVYLGTADQLPDSLIEGIKGAGNAPAYRHTAYVVFDNLNVTSFGNRIPQFTFEVFRRVGTGSSLEQLVTAVAVIPAAGERAYDTVIQSRNLTAIQSAPENNATGKPVADWTVAMDDLEASLPNVNTVFLTVGWFGSDLRCGVCTVKPKVEISGKVTVPDAWIVHGQHRADADVVSVSSGKPAYGGTPSDDSLVRAILDLKARGYTVMLYPFLFMDIASGNSLPNPYGGTGQPAYPWRGRITCHPAPGQSGTVNKTATAGTQVSAFFGSVAASDISVSVNSGTQQVTTTYSGPSEWTYRRFILHYAKLCAAINGISPGAVDGMLLGSELRGVCQVRSSSTAFPAVTALKTLAADVKSILGGGVKVSYGADWSDYNGYNPGDGSNDFFFHLDPLWSDSHIDFIGVDNYVPLADWRDGPGHVDYQAGYRSIYDPAYLQSNIEGGEAYDWYYASQADRDAQVRSPITDGAYSEPWIYRAKDFRNFWLNTHHDRPGGVRSGTATGWVAQSKPIWFTEFGVPSVDKGANQPNVFYDPKSSESFFPYYSSGRPDNLVQRRAIEAFLSYWAAHNPTSTVYHAPMIGGISLWTWDARPFPAWPSRTDLWADGDLWPLGHWIKGKIGFGDLGALVASRCARVGFTNVDVSQLDGIVTGYLRDRPLSPRAEIELLQTAFAFDGIESGDTLKFIPRGLNAVASLSFNDVVLDDSGEPWQITRAQETDLPQAISISFTDINNDYQSGSVQSQRGSGYSERVTSVNPQMVMDETQARAITDRLLAEAWLSRETGTINLPPSQMALEVADVVMLSIGNVELSFRLTRATDGDYRKFEIMRAESALYGPLLPGGVSPGLTVPTVFGQVALQFMDLPLLNDTDIPYAPYVAAAAEPWGGAALYDSSSGSSYALNLSLPYQAQMGESLTDLLMWTYTSCLIDRLNTLRVKVYSGELSSLTEEEVFDSKKNALAIKTPSGDWEILQYFNAVLVSPGVYDLSPLIRGQLGTDAIMGDTVPAGSQIVFLNSAIQQLNTSQSQLARTRYYKWGPPSKPTTDTAWQSGTYVNQGVGLMPWSPVHIAGARDTSGNLTITWFRRTRIGGDTDWDLTTGADIPLNEETEAYQVDILDGGDVVRTISVTTPTASYSAADQVADFGSAQSAVAVNVYQMSAIIGRGRAGKATV